MTVDECSVCGGEIRMQCAVGTGVCCGQCEKRKNADSKVRESSVGSSSESKA